MMTRVTHPNASIALLSALFALVGTPAQSADAAASTSAATATGAPAVLPGDGIRQRDFLFTGQLDHTLYLVKKGEVVWSDHVPGAYGHVQEAILLPNGNFLLAYMTGVKEITADKKVVWNYSAPPKCEVHTAKPIGPDKVLFIQNSVSPFAEVFLADKVSGKIEKLFSFPVGKPDGMHLQTRRAVVTENGTLLVARTDLNRVSEFDQTGKELWSAAVERPWSIQRLANGNTLVCSFEMFVRELDAHGATVWEFAPKDAPEYLMPKWCVATRLSNGNTLVANNTPEPKDPNDVGAPIQAFEVSPSKQIVWALRSWVKPALGPGWIIQEVDDSALTWSLHFGTLH